MSETKPLIIMPCLDMMKGRVVKGVNFVDIKDAGDPVECCKAYCAAGADELAMLDICATVENRATMLEVVKKVADQVTVPFTMGGGISSVQAAEAVLNQGADKISTSSAVYRNPDMIGEMIKAFGAEKVTVAIDVAQNAAMPSGYEVFIDGGRTATGGDAIELRDGITLTVDASTGAGTLANIILPENGTLNLVNVPEYSGSLEMPISGENVTGLANVAGWNLSIDGVAQSSSKRKCRYENGKIVLYNPGTVVVFR
jgi:imidazoleglycerol phosphate synthase cyclase subunit